MYWCGLPLRSEVGQIVVYSRCSTSCMPDRQWGQTNHGVFHRVSRDRRGDHLRRRCIDVPLAGEEPWQGRRRDVRGLAVDRQGYPAADVVRHRNNGPAGPGAGQGGSGAEAAAARIHPLHRPRVDDPWFLLGRSPRGCVGGRPADPLAHGVLHQQPQGRSLRGAGRDRRRPACCPPGTRAALAGTAVLAPLRPAEPGPAADLPGVAGRGPQAAAAGPSRRSWGPRSRSC